MMLFFPNGPSLLRTSSINTAKLWWDSDASVFYKCSRLLKIKPSASTLFCILGVWICVSSPSRLDWSDLWLQAEGPCCCGGPQCVLLLHIWGYSNSHLLKFVNSIKLSESYYQKTYIVYIYIYIYDSIDRLMFLMCRGGGPGCHNRWKGTKSLGMHDQQLWTNSMSAA